MAEEEEVRLEVEALQAVYGNDCCIIEEFPPHLTVQIRPRTADDSSQQFVEAVLGIQANAQVSNWQRVVAVQKYPLEPPQVDIVDCKGLDEKRQACLISSIRARAQELTSCLMLVALCEEAVETLSNMNHPDGNCPLCLYALVTEERHDDNFLPFMKLMSCFHCFHSECLVRWWKWLHDQNQTNTSNLMKTIVSASGDPENQRDNLDDCLKESMANSEVCKRICYLVAAYEMWRPTTCDNILSISEISKYSQQRCHLKYVMALEMTQRFLSKRSPSSEAHGFLKQSQGNCPVCRKVFHTEDIEHVLDLLGTNSSQLILHGTDSDNEEKEFLWSEMENSRRQKFEAILKVQHENSGLIEPRRINVLLPGMFLPQHIIPPAALMETTAESEGDKGSVCVAPSTEIDLGGPSDKTGRSEHSNSRSSRKNRGHYTRKHSSQSGRKQWIKKEKDTC